MKSLFAPSQNKKENVSAAEKSPKHRFLNALAHGRFTEAEIILNNNPAVRSILMHIPGLRHTAFFKNSLKRRIRFYRDYARKYGMTCDDVANGKQSLRNEFAVRHCKTRAISDAAKKLMKDCEIAMLRRYRMKTRRNKRLGLF